MVTYRYEKLPEKFNVFINYYQGLATDDPLL